MHSFNFYIEQKKSLKKGIFKKKTNQPIFKKTYLWPAIA